MSAKCRACEPWEEVIHTHHAHKHRVLTTACEFVKSDRAGVALVVSTLLVGMVENVEVAVTNVITSKDIGDEFQD